MDIILYHGSGFDQTELMPGFMRSGKIVKWDEVESNEWLYTTTDKQEAISQAFASMLEKTYETTGYHTKGNEITVTLAGDSKPSTQELTKLQIFLYSIRLEEEDKWVKNNNEHNQIKTEWKTQSIIDRHIIGKEQVDLAAWLATKRIHFKEGKAEKDEVPNYLSW
jgi:hypothetical protein